jgi:hypothetical protein
LQHVFQYKAFYDHFLGKNIHAITLKGHQSSAGTTFFCHHLGSKERFIFMSREIKESVFRPRNFKVMQMPRSKARVMLVGGAGAKLNWPAAALVRRITIQPLIKRIIGQTDDGELITKWLRRAHTHTHIHIFRLIRSDLIVVRLLGARSARSGLIKRRLSLT